MTDGHKLFITVNYGFDYSKSKMSHLQEFDILTQFFEHRNNLKGYIDDEDGARFEKGSDTDYLVDYLYSAFDSRKLRAKVGALLLHYEMYEVLAEYHSPLDSEGIKLRDELILSKQI